MILYIHGFASSSKSNKVTLLKNKFNDIVALDLSTEPNRAIKQLEKFIEKYYTQTNITLMGSSLGGFYAMYLSKKYSLKAILINPAINPDITLVQYKDKKVKNYLKDEFFYFKSHYLDQLKGLRVSEFDSSKVLLLLQTGDEVLDYKAALDFLPESKSIIESSGSHQFENFENYFEIIENFCMKNNDEDKGLKFRITSEEFKKIKKEVKNIQSNFNEIDYESIGEGISYEFLPFEFGTQVKIKYYNNEFILRMAYENDYINY